MSRRFVVYLGDVYNTEDSPGLASISTSYMLADWLEPIFLSDCSQGEIGELRCVAQRHPEQISALVSEGQAIRVMDAGISPDVDDPTYTPIFEGVVVKLHFVINGESEQVEIIAYNNADYLLHRICIHGQYRRTYEQENGLWTGSATLGDNSVSDIDQLYHIDTPAIFNPDGLYNMSQDTWAIEGRSVDGSLDADGSGSSGGVGGSAGDGLSGSDSVATGMRMFDVPGRNQKTGGDSPTTIKAQPWTLVHAIQYLLTTTPASWAIDPKSWSSDSLQVILANGDPVISNVNCEGKSLAQAMAELLEPYNYGFEVSPIATEEEGAPRQALRFFYKGQGLIAPVRLSVRGSDASTSDSNMISADITIDASPVINSVTSYGDQIAFTTLAHTNPPSVSMGQPPVVKLVKGWTDSDLVWPLDAQNKLNVLDTTFRQNYVNAVNLISIIGDGDSKHYPYGVGRYFVVNLGEQPSTDLADLTPALNDNADGVNSIDPRRFMKPELFDRNGSGGFLHQEEIQVELSFDTGTHWAVVDRSYYTIGTEGMSVTFTEPHLEKMGTKFVTAGFPAGVTYWDALHAGTLQIRILCSIKSDERLAEATLNDGHAFPLSTERIYLNPGYRKVRYNPLISDSVYVTRYAPEQAGNDDRGALEKLNQQHLLQTNRKMIHGSVRCVLGAFREFHPGQICTGIGGRLPFDPAPTILRVVYDFTNQHVQLVLDNKFCKTVISTRTNDDRYAHHVGVESPTQMQGNNVPYVPGNVKSWIRSILGESQKDDLSDGGQ